jgi:hypothetical protein
VLSNGWDLLNFYVLIIAMKREKKKPEGKGINATCRVSLTHPAKLKVKS